MPVFPKPKVPFAYDVTAEVAALRVHKTKRGVPDKQPDALLVGTWNIANFGAQERRAQDHKLIAEILGWFDVVAVQECRDNYSQLEAVVREMGVDYKYVMSDAAGNSERMVFVYDAKKLKLLEEVGEIAFAPSQLKSVKVKGAKGAFDNFDRNPYIASFQLGTALSVSLVNVHLFYGSEKKADIERRALETAAVARWASTRRKSKYAGARELIALGDFNMPMPDAAGVNVVFDALTNDGLVTPPHSSEIGSAIASDNHYDQVAFFPESSKHCLLQVGVFDYDAAVFKKLWESATRSVFLGYLRYYMSDHRPMWLQIRLK